MNEMAFEGTIKEGFARRFTVINERDLKKYGSIEDLLALNSLLGKIEKGRTKSGKNPYNKYVVINLDEPYVDEIIEIMKRNGHWG